MAESAVSVPSKLVSTYFISLSSLFQVFVLYYHLTTLMFLAMVWPTTATAATTTGTLTSTAPDSRCSINNGVVVDESSCKNFLICFNGKAWPLQCSRDLLFNSLLLACDFPANVDCGQRAKHNDGSNMCYSSMINVTVKARNRLKAPYLEVEQRVRAQRQPLRNFLLMAAGLAPRFRFTTQTFPGYGDFVTSINGLANDITSSLAVWQPFDRQGTLITLSIDNYVPENNDVITYVYTSGLGQRK